MKDGKRIALGLVGLGLVSASIYGLTRPVKAVVPPPEVYPCPYCEAEFSTESELLQHIELVHPEEPPPVGTATVYGQVKRGHMTLPDAEIRVDGAFIARTDFWGKYRVDNLTPGSHIIEATWPRSSFGLIMYSGSVEAYLLAGYNEVNISVSEIPEEAPVYFEGFVTDATTGQPLENVRVAFKVMVVQYYETAMAVYTEIDGSYWVQSSELKKLYGDVLVMFTKGGYLSLSQTVPVEPGGRYRVDVSLTPEEEV